MADEIVYKKVTRKADKGLEGKVIAKHGKQTNQKLKPYVVLQYLLKYSDENNTKSAYDIIGYLEDCGISAERRSIYRDIEDINRIMLMLQEDIDLDEADRMFAEAEESGDEEELNELKTVLYDKNKKGFYVRQRKFEVSDMRLLAECVYAAKFIAEGQAKRLVDVICDFVSEKQADRIKHNAFLTDRVKTDNRSVMNNIAAINDAMSRHLDGEPHTPEKITFKYLKYSILLFCLLLDCLSFASGQLCKGRMLLMVFDDVIVKQIAVVAGHLQGGVSHEPLKGERIAATIDKVLTGESVAERMNRSPLHASGSVVLYNGKPQGVFCEKAAKLVAEQVIRTAA